MIDLLLPRHMRGRMWWDDCPQFKYPHDAVLSQLLPLSHHAGQRKMRVALELLRPHGAMMGYGLLGGRFDAQPAAGLAIRVGTSGAAGVKYVANLTGSDSNVYVGLPAEFGPAVLNAACAAVTRGHHLTAGVLEFDRAAHSEVGSSPILFAHLARMVVRLLAVTTADPTAADFFRVVTSTLAESEL